MRGPKRASKSRIIDFRNELARTLASQWADEERVRRIYDPRPLPVRWEVTSTASSATSVGSNNVPASALSRTFEEIFSLYKSLSPPRLIILGTAGAGKSILALKLARELLDAAGPESPIPAIIPAATWDVDTEFSTWISVQLQNSYPGLSQEVRDANGEVVSAAQILMGHQMILPIVDGFDEIPEAQHGKAVEKINRYGSNYPLVLTSRPNEYINAITSVGRGISRASVVEILPLRVEQAEQYLRESTAGTPIDRWDEVFQLLKSKPDGVLAHVLRTPLMLWLARSIYETSARHPVELADMEKFNSSVRIERHLLDIFLTAAYTNNMDNSRHRYQPRQADRWLGFIASQLSLIGERNFVWWQLGSAVKLWRGVFSALRFIIVANIFLLIASTVSSRHGAWVSGSYVEHDNLKSFLLAGPLGNTAWPSWERGYLGVISFFRTSGWDHSQEASWVRHVLSRVSFANFEVFVFSLGFLS